MRKSLILFACSTAFICCSVASAQDSEDGSSVEASDIFAGNPAPQSEEAVGIANAAAREGANTDRKLADTESRLEARIDALEKELAEVRKQAEDAKAAANEAMSSDSKESNYFLDHFWFGSYGRVQPSMNPDGMKSGRQPRIVYPSPRVDEASYVELTLGYTPYEEKDGPTVDVITTLAIDGSKLFHFTGDWDEGLAIRNLYAEVRDLWFDGFVVWAGSRMYRGDDIYLLDTWPLDNLNTYGGGIGWHGKKTRTNVDLHFGTNRLTNDYQYEVVDVASERFVGETDVVYLDRQRFIASLKLEQRWGISDDLQKPQFVAKLYGEVHAIKEGEYLETQPEKVTKLPSDYGWLIGAQFGMSNFLNDSYFNLFLKYSEGLAAYGESAIPFGVDTEKRAAGAQNFMFGMSGGFNFGYVDMLLGGYVRYFKDADGIDEDFDDGVEGVWDIRISGHVGQYFRPGIELSQQLRRPNGLNPVTQKQELASIFKFSVLPAVRFAHLSNGGPLERPEIRFNYTLSVLNEAAQFMFPEQDYLRNTKYVHFIGIAAEWWFNI